MSTERKRDNRSADKWKFYQDNSNRWRWKYIMQGKIAAQAYYSFEQYRDCIQDARLHGYRENSKIGGVRE
ncbi:MAG: hypothetical protein A3F74_11115 [Betaproteobacteria bacterium RIFCSPLOWO2_12_FULL_62_58]|nr:MAG: hypothetical protein A3F74_11115 [Betaproteobacteria bacterium RIFCSPLOWO2_12_FULL_62_58]